MLRKTAIAVLFVVLLPSALAAAANDLSLRHTGTPHDALFDIEFDGSYGIAIGSGGSVLTSEDSGLTWKQDRRPETELSLLGVAVDGGRRFIVGQSGEIFRSGDGAWTKLESGTDARLFQVALGSDGLVAVVGGFGTILISQDDGASWTSPDLDWMEILDDYVEPHLYAVRVAGNVVLVAGEFGLVVRSEDRGATWSVVHRGEESIFAFAFGEGGQGLAVGQTGLVMSTLDGGRSWRKHESLGETNLLGIWRSGARAFAVGIRGSYASNDGGQNWKPVNRSDIETGWYQAVASSAARDKPVLVGHRGRILEMDE